MSATETLRIAHTARCKLQMAADRPDRNLRFILGHAFTLDKLRLRIAEIVDEEDDEQDPEPVQAQQRCVSFSGKTKPAPSGLSDGRRSPPPPPRLEDDLEDFDEEESEDEDEESDALSLRRFGSGAAHAPRIAGEESNGPDGDEGETEPPIFSEDQMKAITEKEGNEELKDAYTRVARCPCHAHEGPVAENFWEVPQANGKSGPRVAVVQVAAGAA